jgi:hypothetical protein
MVRCPMGALGGQGPCPWGWPLGYRFPDIGFGSRSAGAVENGSHGPVLVEGVKDRCWIICPSGRRALRN